MIARIINLFHVILILLIIAVLKEIFMKRIFKAIFALSLVGVFAVNGQNAQAAKYGRGPKVTVPKNMRGTWYSYDSGNDRGGKPDKVTFTAHTVTNSHLKHLTLYKKLSRKKPASNMMQ